MPTTVPLSSLQDTLAAAAQQYGLDPQILLHQAQQESGLNPNSVSKAGAIGVMQLMPGTAKDLGVNPRDPSANIYGGAHYMRQLLDRYDGNYRLALAAYNAGPARVDAYLKGRALPAETQAYVPAILGRDTPPPAPSPSPSGGADTTQSVQPGVGPPDAGAALTLRDVVLANINQRLRAAQQQFNTPLLME